MKPRITWRRIGRGKELVAIAGRWLDAARALPESGSIGFSAPAARGEDVIQFICIHGIVPAHRCAVCESLARAFMR